MAKKESLLEVDKTIISTNLLFEDYDDEPLDKLFPEQEEAEMPSKVVLPTPGFCLKTLRADNKKKVFINVCHTAEIPAPVDITLAELLAMWGDPQEQAKSGSYLVPMSMAAPREDHDKKGVSCDVYDVAINSTFFEKIKQEVYFRTFLLQVVFEGLANKYGAELSLSNGHILHNRTAYGTIRPQNIQIREPVPSKDLMLQNRTPYGTIQPQNIQIREPLPSKNLTLQNQTPYGTMQLQNIQIQELLPSKNLEEAVYNLDILPDYTLGLMGEMLIAKFHMPNVAEKNIKLQLGEDRILVEAPPKYRVDLFVPLSMYPDRSTAVFDCQTEFLDVTVPVFR